MRGGGGSDVLKQLKRQKVLGTVIVTFHTVSKLIGFINTFDADASVYFVLVCTFSFAVVPIHTVVILNV